MDVVDAARRWSTTWERAWNAGEIEPITALYRPDATYRSHPHRPPEEGGARGYVSRVFAGESEVRCRFGAPIAAGDRAAVEWWATMVAGGGSITLTGTTVLRFDADGSVIDHVDYWVEADGAIDPFPGWGTPAA